MLNVNLLVVLPTDSKSLSFFLLAKSRQIVGSWRGFFLSISENSLGYRFFLTFSKATCFFGFSAWELGFQDIHMGKTGIFKP